LGYSHVVPLQPHRYIPVPGHKPGPAEGEPYQLGLVLDEETPNEIAIMDWQEMARTLLSPALYPGFRDWVMTSGVDGYQAARFVGVHVPRYVVGEGEFEIDQYAGEIDQMFRIQAAIGRAHPEWVTKPKARPGILDLNP
jgi:hypothetical protein